MALIAKPQERLGGGSREGDHLVMRQLRISWDIIAGLPSRLLEVAGLPLVNQR